MNRFMTLIPVALVAGVALGQGAASPAEVIKVRQQGLKSIGSAFKIIRDELKSGTPDAAKIKAAGARISQESSAIDGWFPAGTGPESGTKTDAKAEIWSDPAAFDAAREAFVREAAKFAQVFTTDSDPSAWSAATASLGQTCRGCHDKFRVKRD
jgi:cytochrome c556